MAQGTPQPAAGHHLQRGGCSPTWLLLLRALLPIQRSAHCRIGACSPACSRAAKCCENAGGRDAPVAARGIGSRSADQFVPCGSAVGLLRARLLSDHSLAPAWALPCSQLHPIRAFIPVDRHSIGLACNGGPQQGRRPPRGSGAAAPRAAAAPGDGWQRSRGSARAQRRQDHAAGQMARHTSAARGCRVPGAPLMCCWVWRRA